MRYIRDRKPRMVILENVADLLEKADESINSDADYVVQELKETAGYTFANWTIMDADKTGSLARRRRLYFQAVDCQEGVTHEQALAFSESFLHCMETISGNPHSFLDLTALPLDRISE